MPIYRFGGTPDSYVEDRDTGDRLASIELAIFDAFTQDPVTGLLDASSTPAASILTDATGYWAFSCESPAVLIQVTDSIGTTTWGPLVSAESVRDTIADIDALTAAVAAAEADAAAAAADAAAALAAAGASVAHSATTGRDQNDQHPISAITGLQAALDAALTAAQSGGVVGIVYATPQAFSGIDRTGATSSVAGLLAAFNATPDGGILVIPPGTYKIDSVLTLQNKHVTIWAYGAHFIYSSATAAIVMQGSMGTTYTATGAPTQTTSTAFARGEQLAVTTVTLSATPTGYAVGDHVKIVSDDTASPANVKCGQVMMVVAVSGTTVTLNGHLRGTFSTNVRVAKMPGNSTGAYRMKWFGGLGYHDSTVMASGSAGYALLQASRLVQPLIRDFHVINASGPAVYTGHTYKARIIDLTVERLLDGGAVYGYGLNDGGELTLCRGLVAERIRHAYTTGAAQGTNIGDYGRCYGAIVVDGICHGSTQVAWDTHGDGDEVTFLNCHAIDCYYGFQLRGTRNKVLGGRVKGGSYPGAVQITSADGTSSSYGHYIGGGLQLEDIKGPAFWFDTDSVETVPNTIGDVHIRSRDTSKYIIDTDVPVLVEPNGIKVAAGGTRQVIRANGSIAMADTYTYP